MLLIVIPYIYKNILLMADMKPIDLGKVNKVYLAKPKLSELAGKRSSETADAMIEFVLRSRNEWEERIENTNLDN